jgi:uncharacterized protein YbcI
LATTRIFIIKRGRRNPVSGIAETTDIGGTRVAPRAAALSISNAVARLHKQFVGRGPRNTTTIIERDLVVSVLEGGLTIAEQTLTHHGRHDIVAAQRVALQNAMRDAMVAAVQEITGRLVGSYMNATDGEFSLRAEIFVLIPEVQTADSPLDAPGVG